MNDDPYRIAAPTPPCSHQGALRAVWSRWCQTTTFRMGHPSHAAGKEPCDNCAIECARCGEMLFNGDPHAAMTGDFYDELCRMREKIQREATNE